MWRISQARNPNSDLVFVLSTAAFTIVVGLIEASALRVVGGFMILISRFWFAGQVLREMTFPNALLVFFVPFMPTIYLFKRFDVAWKPVFFGAVGIVAVLVSTAAYTR